MTGRGGRRSYCSRCGADVTGSHNLAAVHRELRVRARGGRIVLPLVYETTRVCDGSARPPAPQELDVELRDALRALAVLERRAAAVPLHDRREA